MKLSLLNTLILSESYKMQYSPSFDPLLEIWFLIIKYFDFLESTDDVTITKRLNIQNLTLASILD